MSYVYDLIWFSGAHFVVSVEEGIMPHFSFVHSGSGSGNTELLILMFLVLIVLNFMF